jgi:preprotein translocase subunit SecY
MGGLLRAFVSTPGLRTKLALMVLAVALYRLGHNVPGPGVDVRAVRAAADATVRDDPFVALVDLLSGGGLLRLSVLGLGVFPYLLALLAVQLLTQIHPRMRALAAEGRWGKARLDRHALILTALVGAVMAAAVVVSAAGGRLPGGDVLTSTTPPTLLAMAGCMTAGAVATAGLARMLSTAAFGNGIGLLFFVQVAAGFAGRLADVHEEHGGAAFAAAVAVAALSAVVVVGAVIQCGGPDRRDSRDRHRTRDRPGRRDEDPASPVRPVPAGYLTGISGAWCPGTPTSPHRRPGA